MNELVIKSHDFEIAKKRLKDFSQKKSNELEIRTVNVDGGFLGLGNHKVTGQELNSRLGTIQEHLINLNNTNNKTINEFGQIYKALELLDKDYMQAIVTSVKAIQKNHEKISITQDEIKKIVNNQKKTVEHLKNFKNKLDSYAHLEDIDLIWNNYLEINKGITVLSNSLSSAMMISEANKIKIDDLQLTLKNANKKSKDLSNQLSQQSVKLETINKFMNELEKSIHLKDVDEMWEQLLNAHKDLESLKATTLKQQSDLDTLQSFVEILSSYTHLNDIDVLWDKSEQQELKLNEVIEVNKEIKFNMLLNTKIIKELHEYKEHLSQLKQLDNIDTLWETSEIHSNQLTKLTQKGENTFEFVQQNQISIQELIEYKSKLCKINHLMSVDEIWNSNQKHSERLSELEQYNRDLNHRIQINQDRFETDITNIVKNNNLVIQQFTKKIKFLYLVAGGALGLALIELIVILWTVI